MKTLKTHKLFIIFSYFFLLTACISSQPRFKIFEHFHQEPIDNARISNVINSAKKEGYLIKLDINEENAEILFRSMLVEHNLPEELRNNENLRNELLKVAKEKAGKSSPLPPDEAKRTHELIVSGEVFNDIFYSFNTIFSLVAKPDRFTNLDSSVKDHIATAIHLSDSVISDLNPESVFNQVSTQIKLVQAGELPQNPEVLNNTLKTVFSAPEVGNSIEVINALLAPENESIRIAVLVYSRLNGINLEQNDIDKLRDTILDRENPNFVALLRYLLIPKNATRLAGVG